MRLAAWERWGMFAFVMAALIRQFGFEDGLLLTAAIVVVPTVLLSGRA